LCSGPCPHVWRIGIRNVQVEKHFPAWTFTQQGSGLLFLGVTSRLAISGAGVLYSRRWAYSACLLLIGANGLGDVVHILRGDLLKGLTGLFFASLFLLYLLNPCIKGYFSAPHAHNR